MSKQEPATEPADRLAFIATGNAEDLPALLSEMEKRNIKLVAIHDRPLKTELGQYDYLIECESTGFDNYEKMISKTPLELRYLGSFKVK